MFDKKLTQKVLFKNANIFTLQLISVHPIIRSVEKLFITVEWDEPNEKRVRMFPELKENGNSWMSIGLWWSKVTNLKKISSTGPCQIGSANRRRYTP